MATILVLGVTLVTLALGRPAGPVQEPRSVTACCALLVGRRGGNKEERPRAGAGAGAARTREQNEQHNQHTTFNLLGELLLVLVELEDVLENWGSAVLPWEIEMVVDEFEEEDQ